MVSPECKHLQNYISKVSTILNLRNKALYCIKLQLRSGCVCMLSLVNKSMALQRYCIGRYTLRLVHNAIRIRIFLAVRFSGPLTTGYTFRLVLIVCIKNCSCNNLTIIVTDNTALQQIIVFSATILMKIPKSRCLSISRLMQQA